MKRGVLVILLILCLSIFLYSFLYKEPPKPYYDTRELAIDSLLAGNTYILKALPVDENREIIVFYDKSDEAIFMATIYEDKKKAKFIVEEQTKAWKIGSQLDLVINGVYKVEDIDITFYAWKGFDKLDSLIEENQVIAQNKDKIHTYDRELYLLLVIDD